MDRRHDLSRAPSQGPGTNILSASNSCDTCTKVMSGTSMATPHVSGSVALFRAVHPSANPAQVRQAIVSAASPISFDSRSPLGLLDVIPTR